MAQDQRVRQAVGEPQGPPMPKWAYSIVNPAMATILRTPLHGLLSKSLMMLIFDGRKSGKRYSIPVGYLREGDKLYIFSHSAWAKNFIGGATVAVRLQGELRRGNASVIDDANLIGTLVRRMISERGEEMSQRMGFLATDPNGSIQPQTPKGTTFIEIQLDR